MSMKSGVQDCIETFLLTLFFLTVTLPSENFYLAACCSQAVASRCTVLRTGPSRSDNYLMFSVPAATLNGHKQISVDNQFGSGANCLQLHTASMVEVSQICFNYNACTNCDPRWLFLEPTLWMC